MRFCYLSLFSVCMAFRLRLIRCASPRNTRKRRRRQSSDTCSIWLESCIGMATTRSTLERCVCQCNVEGEGEAGRVLTPPSFERTHTHTHTSRVLSFSNDKERALLFFLPSTLSQRPLIGSDRELWKETNTRMHTHTWVEDFHPVFRS